MSGPKEPSHNERFFLARGEGCMRPTKDEGATTARNPENGGDHESEPRPEFRAELRERVIAAYVRAENAASAAKKAARGE